MIVVLVVALFVGAFTLSGLVTMWAWNLLVAGVFNGPVIDFWQAIAALVLISAVRGVTWKLEKS